MDPIALLQEELKDDDPEVVVAAINRVCIIACSLGPERCRRELIPFLTEFGDADHDEAHASLARQLAEFTDLIGGPQHIVLLLPLLEKLAGQEEVVVRDAAAESLAKLVTLMPKPDVTAKFIPTLQRLATGDWFTNRVSACAIFDSLYKVVPEATQADLRQLFNNLCLDDTPMVRKAAFKHLAIFAGTLQKPFLKQDTVRALTALSTDDLEAMRVATIPIILTLSRRFDASEFMQLALPIVEALADDSSWRVRKELMLEMGTLSQAATNSVDFARALMSIYVRGLTDLQSEVRAGAAKPVGVVCANLKGTGNVLQELVVPLFEKLASDPAVAVRDNFAKAVMPLAVVFAKECQKLIVPLIVVLTKDENPDVRLSVLEECQLLGDAIGPANMVTTLLSFLLDLSKDLKWRVRQAVLVKSTLLAQPAGVKVFEKKLQPLFIGALTDHVFTVRETACASIGTLTRVFGGKWAADQLFPIAFQIYDKSTNYLHRMTCLQIMVQSAPHCAVAILDKQFLPLVAQSVVDDVANVRIATAKTIQVLGKAGAADKAFIAKLKPLLAKLQVDPDKDVVFSATQALASL